MDSVGKPLKTSALEAHIELFKDKACPICHHQEIMVMGDGEDGDAYEFTVSVAHPPGFGLVPFVAAMCGCCGHVMWFLKDAIDHGSGGDHG